MCFVQFLFFRHALVGIWVNQRIVVDAIIWSQVMIAIAMIAGLWKYST